MKIRDEASKELESHKEIEKSLVQHFQDIAKEPEVDRSKAIQRILRHIPILVVEEHNQNLRKPITPEEVDQAVQEMPNEKAPRPDGFTMDLFKACWEVVKQDIYDIVEDSNL